MSMVVLGKINEVSRRWTYFFPSSDSFATLSNVRLHLVSSLSAGLTTEAAEAAVDLMVSVNRDERGCSSVISGYGETWMEHTARSGGCRAKNWDGSLSRPFGDLQLVSEPLRDL